MTDRDHCAHIDLFPERATLVSYTLLTLDYSCQQNNIIAENEKKGLQSF